MLYWVHASGEPLVAYSAGKGTRGKQFVIRPNDFDVESLYIDVELTADVPTDRMARINAAAMAVRELGYSRERALEQIGETDPQYIMAQAEEEERRLLRLQIEKERTATVERFRTQSFLSQAQARQKALAEKQAALSAPKSQAAQTKPPQQAARLAALQDLQSKLNAHPEAKEKIAEISRRQAGAPRGVTGVGGQGFNPALGGTPPAVAAPGVKGKRKKPAEKPGYSDGE